MTQPFFGAVGGLGLRRPVVSLGLLLALGVAPASLLAQEADPQIFEFEIELAPVCLDGTFPISIQTDGAALGGTLEVTTNSKGAISGTLVLVGSAYDVTGKVAYRAKGHKLSLLAVRGKDKIKIAAKLGIEEDDDAFVGSAKGTGKTAVFTGKRGFTLDVSDAAPQVARFTTQMTTDAKNRVLGSASVFVCGRPLDLELSGKVKKKSKITLRGESFKFTGKGGPTLDIGVPLSWNAKGYGAVTKSEGLMFDLVTPPATLTYADPLVEYEVDEPSAQNTPSSTGSPVVEYAIAPALPNGMTFDTVTGTLAGTPTSIAPLSVFTVTASNLAGETTGTITFSIRANRAKSLLPYPGPLTDDDMRHFLTRSQFAVEDADLQVLKDQGLNAFIEQMLVFEQNTQLELDAFPILTNVTDPPGFEGQFPSDRQLAEWWTYLLTNNPNAFQEVLTLFWQDHFAISSDVLAGTGRRHWMVDYANLLRHTGNGNFRDLILATARDPAMLRFLDGEDNRDGAPNENYARELWELYMLGVDNGYTQEDIVESARALTGYRSRYNTTTTQYYTQFESSRHDGGPKTFLGRTITAQDATDDFDAVVDITLDERDPEIFICRKLWQWFVYDDPDEAVIAQLGAQFRAGGWQIAPVLRTMFRSEAFFSPRARNNFVKSPIEYGIGFVRGTGLYLTERETDILLTDLGQRITQPPTVDGWTSGTQWFSAQSMTQRTNFVHLSIEDTNDQRNKGIEVADILPPVPERTAIKVVESLARRMRVQLSEEDVDDYVDYLNTLRLDNGTTQPSPFDGTDQGHLDLRVRGLIYALAQHPTFHIK